MGERIERFRIDIPEAEIDEVKARLRKTRWPHEIGDNSEWQAGTSLDFMRDLVEHWLHRYDWREHEAAMNGFPQYRTTIDGIPIHFIHVKGRGPNPMPLVINHGWPWTFWDMRKIIGPLTDPEAHGGRAEDSFDVVAPSLPGFTFSSPLTVAGVNSFVTADLWVKLMDRLGYDRFATQGGDIGAFVSAHLGHKYPDRIIGAHIHLILPTKPPLVAPEDYGPGEEEWPAQFQRFWSQGNGYMEIQRTRPQTIAFAMHDSPVGLAAWLIDKRHAWADTRKGLDAVFSKDDLITTAMLYWLTETYVSSAHHYYAGLPAPDSFVHDREPVVEAPTAVLQFEHDVWLLPKKWAERYYNLKRWNVSEEGGHFAPAETPDVLVDDIRAFFRTIRS